MSNLSQGGRTTGRSVRSDRVRGFRCAPSRGWLIKLITPLGDATVGRRDDVSLADSDRAAGKSELASALGSVWNASVATMLGDHAQNFCWGGGTAIRRRTFQRIERRQFWHGAVSDDLALTNALRSGKQILFVPECIAPTPYARYVQRACGIHESPDYFDSRLFAENVGRAAVAHLSLRVSLDRRGVHVLQEMIPAIRGDNFSRCLALAIPLLAAMKGALRTIAIGELLPEWKTKMREWSWGWTVLAPIVPFLFFWNFCVSLATKQIRWRGIRYRLVSINQTQILRP